MSDAARWPLRTGGSLPDTSVPVFLVPSFLVFREAHAVPGQPGVVPAGQIRLGDDFLGAVADGLQRIERTPEGFSLATPALPGREVRRHVLARLPYSVFYEVCPDEVVVLAVVHGRRRPGA